MSRILLIDDAIGVAEMMALVIRERLGHEIDVCFAVEDVDEFLDRGHPYDLAIVDLSFNQEVATGLDALVLIDSRSPTTALAIITQGDGWVAGTMRDAWELLPVRTVISKTAPLEFQLTMIEALLAGDDVPIDPALQPLLPSRRNPARTPTRFGQLIQHQGHAKVWRTLMDRRFDATYKNVADATGLKLNTVKNYRTQLLPELSLHGLDEPSLREMQDFAWRCRSFLRPHVDAALGAD